jgi:hypothetical protein
VAESRAQRTAPLPEARRPVIGKIYAPWFLRSSDTKERMSSSPLATVTKHRFAPFVNGAVIAIAVTLGLVVGFVVRDSLPGPLPVRFAVVIVGLYLVLAGRQLFRDDPTTTLYDDHLEYAGPQSLTIAYEDVEIVVVKGGVSNGLLGTKSYEVVTRTGPNLTLRNLTGTEEFERILGDRIVDPREQYETRDAESRPFWQLWPRRRAEHVPDRGIVLEDDLETAMDVDLSDISLDGIDDAIDSHDLDDFDDIEAAVDDAGDAGTFDDSSDGGGSEDDFE